MIASAIMSSTKVNPCFVGPDLNSESVEPSVIIESLFGVIPDGV